MTLAVDWDFKFLLKKKKEVIFVDCKTRLHKNKYIKQKGTISWPDIFFLITSFSHK